MSRPTKLGVHYVKRVAVYKRDKPGSRKRIRGRKVKGSKGAR